MGTGTNLRFVLYSHIHEAFSLDELAELCLELQVEYDNLEGNTLSKKTGSLIAYAIRHGSLPTLIAICMQKRPQKQNIWDKLKRAAEQQPSQFSTTPANSEQIQSISIGLTALAQLVQEQKSFGSFATSFQKDVASAQMRVNKVHYYKRIHDHFQLMEDSYNLVLHDRRTLSEGASDWLFVETNGSILDEDISKVLGAVAEATFVEATEPWLVSLTEGQQCLHTAVTSTNLDNLDRALRILQRTLDQGPTRINDRLVQSVRDLPFAGLVNGLKAVFVYLRQLPQMKISLLKQLAQGIKNLADLAKELVALTQQHNLWQGFDDLLRHTTMSMAVGLDELKLTWPDLQKMGQNLYGNGRAQTLLLLQKLEKNLDAALQKGDVSYILTHFDAYRSRASRFFREIDKRLLDYCLELQQIITPINTLLSVFE